MKHENKARGLEELLLVNHAQKKAAGEDLGIIEIHTWPHSCSTPSQHADRCVHQVDIA